MGRRVSVLLFLGMALFVAAPASALQPGDELPVVVIDVSDPMDQRLIDFLTETLSTERAHLFVLRVDSPGISSGDPGPLYEAIRSAEAPVVTWVGAAPAVAYGGAALLLTAADIAVAAPGTRIGYLEPVVVRDPIGDPGGAVNGELPSSAESLRSAEVIVSEPIPGFVDEVVPAVGQLIAGLDGRAVPRGERTLTIATATVTEDEGGETVTVLSREILFVKPGLLDRVLRTAARPETAFFFLIVGIATATFEFYAAGVGVTAVVAVIALFLSGYGLATLPISWPSVAAVLLGLLLYTADFQRNTLGWRSMLGTVLLIVGGLTFTDAQPQFGPIWWVVLLIVTATALFYGFALTTVVRARFSTRTIGREHLIGLHGVAATDLTPTGIVTVQGARWRGRTQRAAGVKAGDPIEVEGVTGIELEVVPRDRSNRG